VDLRRFLDLYAAETQEHLRLLNRGILDLESVDAARATDEAFRAAHTIKGLSAAMGYSGVTDLAHGLEDCLAELRAGRLAADDTVVDQLLETADALERAIAAAIEAGPTTPPDSMADDFAELVGDASLVSGSGLPSHSPAPLAGAPPAPAGRRGERAVRVRLRADAPIKSARAVLVLKAAERTGELRAHEPAVFTDDFDGTLTLVFGPDVSEAEAEAAILSAGDIETVIWGPRASAAPSPTIGMARERAALAAPPPRRAAHMRIDPAHLDHLAEGIAEASVLHARLQQATATAESGVAGMVDRLGTLLSELQRTILVMRMVPVSELFDRFPRLVRDAARALDKQVEFRMEGADIQLDRAILEEMVDPLVHLLRNAVDHGIEPPSARVAAGKAGRGDLLLRAERERSSVLLQVIDDGHGIDRGRVFAAARAAGILATDSPDDDIGDDELLRLLSQPGFSTAVQVTEVSGRGVGMDAVVARIRSVGGAITLETRPGSGTTFSLRLPLTLALVQALRVRVGGDDYAIPLTHVSEAVELTDVMTAAFRGRESLRLRNELLPLVRLRSVLGSGGEADETAAVIAEIGERRAALAVDELIGREQILVKSFDPAVGMLPYFSGATLLADGRPALILDPLSVM
jgi:two-component system chemotaxis sensor kinase CheA